VLFYSLRAFYDEKKKLIDQLKEEANEGKILKLKNNIKKLINEINEKN
jgi:hypothetical protein